jgi:hypothetical protein
MVAHRRRLLKLAMDLDKTTVGHARPVAQHGHHVNHYKNPDGAVDRHGLFAKPSCADNIACARELLAVPKPQGEDTVEDNKLPMNRCPCCGGHMIIIETFEPGTTAKHRPTGPISSIRIDTS